VVVATYFKSPGEPPGLTPGKKRIEDQDMTVDLNVIVFSILVNSRFSRMRRPREEAGCGLRREKFLG
jgi:hypothetical protein